METVGSLASVSIRSKIYDECYRDEDGHLTMFKSGPRVMYIEPASHPLPKFLSIGQWRATLYHFGQDREKEGTTARGDASVSATVTEPNTDDSDQSRHHHHHHQQSAQEKVSEHVSTGRPTGSKQADIKDFKSDSPR